MVDEKETLSPRGLSWYDYKQANLTQEEIEIGDLYTQIISEVIRARRRAGKTQRTLGRATNIHQSVISRLERRGSNTSVRTVLRVLLPLGKTLKVVNVKNKKK